MRAGEIERLVGYLLARGTPLLTNYAMRRGEKPISQYYQEEIEHIRRVVGSMGGRKPCPIENPEFASKIVRMVFEETRKEVGGEHEMSTKRRDEVKEKVKTKVMEKLGMKG